MHRLVAVLVALGALTQPRSPAADWPVFRGDAAQTGVAAEALPEKLAIRWQFKTGGDVNTASVEGTAAIASGVVFVGAFDDYLHAIDLVTGTEKWKLKTGAIKVPVGVHGGAVYAGNIDGALYCVDAATGKERWKYMADAEVSSGVNFTDRQCARSALKARRCTASPRPTASRGGSSRWPAARSSARRRCPVAGRSPRGATARCTSSTRPRGRKSSKASP